jgi:hypothetical protein
MPVGILDDGGRPGPVNGFWEDSDWVFCRDAKWRPVKSGHVTLDDGPAARLGSRGAGDGTEAKILSESEARTFDDGFPLIDGKEFRPGSKHPLFSGKSRAKMLQGYGNGIVAPQAQAFIESANSATRTRHDEAVVFEGKIYRRLWPA